MECITVAQHDHKATIPSIVVCVGGLEAEAAASRPPFCELNGPK